MWFVAAAVFSFLAVSAIVQTTGIRELILPLTLIPSLFAGLAWAGYRKQKRVGA